ncbi:MAG: COX15/CtaA family protein [Hyphomicrobiaceae bacterium]|nr:COX15/CtaA family protein [Hyphomicrobiaceae bacterium]
MRLWLLCIAGLVLAMIVVGGATRLTDSGLSITEWQPLLGVIPPLSEADWQLAFAKYKQIPEYELVNKGMSMAEFQFIYWWEWAHRFLGRFIGLAFAVPFLVFWATGRLRAGLAPRLLGILALGGLQGFFGWYMVQSGLSERIDVSHYRLALHLTTAFLILAAVVWVAADLGEDRGRIRLNTLSAGERRVAALIVAGLVLQVVIGGFVAGLKAGLTYNTWPLMDGRLVPDGLVAMVPWYINFTENVATVQFTHRVLAYALVIAALWHALAVGAQADDERLVNSARLMAAAFLAQAALGVWTLLAAGEAGHIPIGLGLIHQGGGAVVMAIAVWHLHRVWRSAT